MAVAVSQREVCPVCSEPFNHVVDNGYRNTWPQVTQFWVCTPTDSDHVYVHTDGGAE